MAATDALPGGSPVAARWQPGGSRVSRVSEVSPVSRVSPVSPAGSG
ncbi:MAG: hypothetical protein KGP10_00520 [Actinomycetales bacterium]|nr:hypothetical protein [Actinomycetales bacterium]